MHFLKLPGNFKGRWRWIFILAAIFGLFLLVSETSSNEPPPEKMPVLIVESSVAGDFKTLALETWEQFLTVFRARANCFGDVRLQAAFSLESRAAYDPTTATVTVRVPATAALLREALVHEWAHHLEFQCAAQQQLRAKFLAAQELPPDTPWRPDHTPAHTPEREWASIPSEQYAEATIEVVLGRRQIPTGVKVKPAAVQVIKSWAAGD